MEMQSFGYNRIEFSRNSAIGKTGKELQGQRLKNTSGQPIYYYQHYGETACYYCIVNASNASSAIIDGIPLSAPERNLRKLAYYRALARERYELSKASDYINGSSEQRNI